MLKALIEEQMVLDLQENKDRKMEQFVKRMIDERDNLAGKVKRLDAFINDTSAQSKFKALSKEEQELDKKQLEFMKGYLSCLQERIKLHTSN